MKYHRTYHVPPKTSLIGLLGAALGREDIDLDDLYNNVSTNALLITSKGIANDLWTITKLKAEAKAERAPVLREIIVEPIYWIYYMVTDNHKITLEQISNAFKDPVFALSLGRSDELVLVADNDIVELGRSPPSAYYRNTILPFNYKEFSGGLERLDITRGQVLNLPQLAKVPVSFTFDKGRVRKASQYLTVTMVYDVGVKIKEREDGWIDNDRSFFLY